MGAASKTALKKGEWTHVAVSVDRGKTVKIFINGEYESSAPKGISIHTGPLKDIITIGGTNRFFNGAIDSLCFFKGTLSEEDVSALYKQEIIVRNIVGKDNKLLES